MEINFWYIILGFLGFCAYEVGIRVIDEKTAWVRRIGFWKYLLYLFVFGGAVSVVASGFAFSFIPGDFLSVAMAVVFGMGMPATIRLFAEVATKLVFKRAETVIKGGKRTEEPATGELTGNGVGEDANVEGGTRTEETRTAVPPYKPVAYHISDLFGFSHKM